MAPRNSASATFTTATLLLFSLPHSTAQTLSTSALPPGSTTDSAPDTDTSTPSSSDSSDSDEETSRHIVNYYFVFIALAFAIAALGLVFIVRRRRRQLALMPLSQYTPQRQRQPAIHRTRYWNGRGYFGGGGGAGDEEHARPQEGLNEFGEAPPPYVPKRRSEEEVLGGSGGDGPAVPMQTLRREDAGLKPPGYEEVGVGNSGGSGGEGSDEGPVMRPR
ncbi:hypothetical protein MBLNU230_g3943t1 [Neophaeotheca triangularis]